RAAPTAPATSSPSSNGSSPPANDAYWGQQRAYVSGSCPQLRDRWGQEVASQEGARQARAAHDVGLAAAGVRATTRARVKPPRARVAGARTRRWRPVDGGIVVTVVGAAVVAVVATVVV